jgi:hypothetical protein
MKLLFYKMFYLPILIYETETSTWSERDVGLSEFQAVDMEFSQSFEK